MDLPFRNGVVTRLRPALSKVSRPPSRRRPSGRGDPALTLCEEVAPSRSSRLAGRGIVEDYRLYLINPRDGHIYGARDIEAADDEAALRIAAGELRRPAELWAGPRKVADLPQTEEMKVGAAQAAH